MKFHSYAEIFPLVEGAALDELVSDIKAHGLREKIWTYEGKILDGRNRFLACQRAKVEAAFREYKGKDALAFVVSLNIQRRHLTDAQRAMAAARIATLKNPGRPSEIVSRDTISAGEAAEKLDVSRSSVQRAKKVVDKGSKALQKAVDSGEVPLNKAAAVTNLPKREQLAAAREPAKPPHTDAPLNGGSDEQEPVIETDDPHDPEKPSEEEMVAADDDIEREYQAAVAKVLDKGAETVIREQAARIAALEQSRDHYMREKTAAVQTVKARDRTIAKLEREKRELSDQVASLRERVAIMEDAA